MNKQTIIIMEGVDMVGKTTISKVLADTLKIPIFKCKRNDKWFDPLVDLLYAGETLLQFVTQTKCSVLFDRLYPSEYAYSMAYDRPTSYEKLKSIDNHYAKIGTKIVILYKDIEHYQEDDNIHDGKPLINIDKYDDIKNAFFKFANESKCDVLLLNTSDENLEKQIEIIINFIKK